jgi:hypothetical protein
MTQAGQVRLATGYRAAWDVFREALRVLQDATMKAGRRV